MSTTVYSTMQRLGWVVVVTGLCAGCETMQPKVDFAEAKPIVQDQPVAQRASGSLYQQVSYRPGFEDPRARFVGDIVTIRIVENVTASQKSSTTANRTTSADGSISAVPGLDFPDAASTNRTRISANSANDFSGKGGTESANTFSGSITTTVAEVLPNGHLLVVGEKQIGVNQNVDVLRFSGTVNPRSIQPGNIVNSSQVANVRVESKARGAQNEAQTVGWLMRFFFSFLPF
jgi:flagellar L-ring protein precursor FlgH